MASMIILTLISSLTSMYLVYENVSNSTIKIAKNNVQMLNKAIFQGLRTAMNTGDASIIQKVKDEARTIEGISGLKVLKSKKLIELYSPNTIFTNDSKILESFSSKKIIVLEEKHGDSNTLRMIEPMLATNDCIACHANQKVGDVIGVIDLSYSMDESYLDIYDITFNNLIITSILGIITIIIIFFILI